MAVRLLGMLWLAGCLLASAVVAEGEAEVITEGGAEDSPALRVVTYNIRYANPEDGPDVWSNRVESVSGFLDRQDIAGLQEVTFPQLQDLRQRLDAFDAYGVGRDDGKQGGEHAPIFYRRERLEPVEQGTFWLSETPDQVGVAGWDAALPRTCTWMILRDKISGASMLVANTHFDHRGSAARAESGKLVLRMLRERAGDLAVILLGDFNCEAGSDPYRGLTAEDYLVDARVASQTEPTGPNSTWNGFEEIVAGRVIDHIFVHGGLDVLELATLDPRTPASRFASDHLPVRALIAVRQN